MVQNFFFELLKQVPGFWFHELLAFSILKQIELAGGTINVDAILNVATQSSTNSDSLLFNSILLLIIVCWILGVVDAYRIGKKRDLEEQSTSQGSNSKGD